jgi:hypothetical protein
MCHGLCSVIQTYPATPPPPPTNSAPNLIMPPYAPARPVPSSPDSKFADSIRLQPTGLHLMPPTPAPKMPVSPTLRPTKLDPPPNRSPTTANPTHLDPTELHPPSKDLLMLPVFTLLNCTPTPSLLSLATGRCHPPSPYQIALVCSKTLCPAARDRAYGTAIWDRLSHIAGCFLLTVQTTSAAGCALAADAWTPIPAASVRLVLGNMPL